MRCATWAVVVDSGNVGITVCFAFPYLCVVRVSIETVATTRVEVAVVHPPLYVRVVLIFMNMLFLISDPVMIYYILYVIFTWLGNFASPFFFCYHLLVWFLLTQV